MEMGSTYSGNERQQMGQAFSQTGNKGEGKDHEDNQAGCHGKGGNYLEQDSIRQTKMKSIDRGYILQWMDKALVK